MENKFEFAKLNEKKLDRCYVIDSCSSSLGVLFVSIRTVSLIFLVFWELLEGKKKFLELLRLLLISVHYMINVYLVVSRRLFFALFFFDQHFRYSSFQFFHFIV
jgi:hypothetical protein